MKTSLAILLLIGAVKNVKLGHKEAVVEGQAPPDDILLGTKARNIPKVDYVQTLDHENDSDDLVEEQEYSQIKKDAVPIGMLVQMPHENDTEDLSFETGVDTEDVGYNHQHSAMWNDIVNKKA